jgi:hypothetical protein
MITEAKHNEGRESQAGTTGCTPRNTKRFTSRNTTRNTLASRRITEHINNDDFAAALNELVLWVDKCCIPWAWVFLFEVPWRFRCSIVKSVNTGVARISGQ